jgi:hypothetical protein
MKHNKKRNTAFIYETLARELTKTIVAKDLKRKEKIFGILKEFFTDGTILGEELRLYRILLETNNIQANVAQRLLEEAKAARNRLDENNIFDTQSKLIGTVNKGLGLEVWGNFVPNFKSLASINAIFGSKTSIKKRVLFEQAIVDKMSKKLLSKVEAHMKPLDNLAYNAFIKKFNTKYGQLLQEQKELLNRYVTTFTDDGLELKVYLNEEISRLKTSLTAVTKTNVEPLITEKVEGVLNYLEGFRHREFEDSDLDKVLRTQELVQEFLSDD